MYHARRIELFFVDTLVVTGIGSPGAPVRPAIALLAVMLWLTFFFFVTGLCAGAHRQPSHRPTPVLDLRPRRLSPDPSSRCRQRDVSQIARLVYITNSRVLECHMYRPFLDVLSKFNISMVKTLKVMKRLRQRS